jgi:hypothetical protein
VATRVFLLTTLREDATREGYEDFVRRVDYPIGRSLPGIEAFEVVRLQGPLSDGGSVPYDYVEVVDVESPEAYARVLASPEVERMTREWSTHVAQAVTVIGEVIE